MQKVLMTLLLVTFFFISSQPANSMCVYNTTDKALRVTFFYGTFSATTWSLDPDRNCESQSTSRPTDTSCFACVGGTQAVIVARCFPTPAGRPASCVPTGDGILLGQKVCEANTKGEGGGHVTIHCAGGASTGSCKGTGLKAPTRGAFNRTAHSSCNGPGCTKAQ